MLGAGHCVAADQSEVQSSLFGLPDAADAAGIADIKLPEIGNHCIDKGLVLVKIDDRPARAAANMQDVTACLGKQVPRLRPGPQIRTLQV
jgi:hypothetical protein